MQLINRIILFLSLFTSIFHSFIAMAGDIQGYIGEQSFNLQDDPELRKLIIRSDEIKQELARAEDMRNQVAGQVKITEAQFNELKSKQESLMKEIDSSIAQKKALQTKLEELKKDEAANAEAIAATTKLIEEINLSIAEKTKRAGALKLELPPIATRLDQQRADLLLATKRAEDASIRLQNANRDRMEYRQDLINALKGINAEGARVGQNDGGRDGAQLSAKLGFDRGSRDGQVDGFNQGTIDGQDRYYRMGADQGERDGAARARLEGERDGRIEGTINGNMSAANREGTAAGIKRANSSDAANVGTIQGKKAGMERAIQTGQVDGRNIGEEETTKKLEGQELANQILDGAFAGSFARSTPNYPGAFNGPSYNPNIFHSKELMKKAYADGYTFTYREYTRYEFQRRIDTDYNNAYDRSYREAHTDASNREYPAYYEQGRVTADSRAYNRDYPIVKAEAARIAFNEFDRNPNRSSNEFKTTYKKSEQNAYDTRYEEIRYANYARAELEVFNANISEQTEIYRQKRITEVNAVYNNNAVLDFVSSDMQDAGIKGVAAFDGIFQAGEATLHSVTLKNFGFKAANNVSIQLDNGNVIKLPAIPARSTVLIKGAGQSIVNTALNSTFTSRLKVRSELNTKDPVEARHFDQMDNGILKANDQKSVRVQFPIALSGFNIDSQLLKGQKNKLKMTITNNSKRAYTGELKIKLAANSQNAIITKDFSSILKLESSVSLSDAEILVDSEADIYRDLSISAQIEQNGVVIGVIPQSLSLMAKAQYSEKAKAIVLVANSDTQLSDLLDALNEAGGSEKVSILDLSLSQINAATLANGLSQKVLIIIDDRNASTVSSLNNFIAQSKSSSFVFVDDELAGLKNVLNLSSLKDATHLVYGKRPVIFSNEHRAPGVKKSSSFMQSSLRNFMNDLGFANALTLSATEMMSAIKANVSTENFKEPNETIKLFSFKALVEVLNINTAYDESGGIFNRDKKWPEMIEKDGSLFLNQLRAASKGDVDTAKLPYVLSALAMKDTISNAMSYGDGIYRIMKLKIRNTTNKVLDDMEDDFKKSLKKNFKEIYNTAYDNAKKHRPFTITIPETNPNNF